MVGSRGGASTQAELGSGFEGEGGEVASEQLGKGGGGDHGGVVGGEGDGGEGDGKVAAAGFGGEGAAEFGVGGDATADEDAACAEVGSGGEGGAGEVFHDGMLEAGDEVARVGVEVGERGGECAGVRGFRVKQAGGAEGSFTLPDGGLHGVEFGIAADGGFEAAEGEVEASRIGVGKVFARQLGGGVAGGFLPDLGEGKEAGVGCTVGGEDVDPGAAGVGKAEEFGDFVEGFAGGVIEGFANVAVAPCCCFRLPGLRGEIEVRVAAADDEGEERVRVGEGSGGVHEDGVDMAFQVIDGDQREVGAEGEGFGEGDADEQGPGEARAFSDGDGVKSGVGQRSAER